MKNVECFIFGVLCGMLVSVIILCVLLSPHPSAMAVYQGKTTLEITYKDGIPVDSVVVFKD